MTWFHALPPPHPLVLPLEGVLSSPLCKFEEKEFHVSQNFISPDCFLNLDKVTSVVPQIQIFNYGFLAFCMLFSIIFQL